MATIVKSRADPVKKNARQRAFILNRAVRRAVRLWLAGFAAARAV